MQPFLGFRLKALWQFIQNIGGLVNPASLPTRAVIYFAERFPKAQRTISNGQLRGDLQSSSFYVYKHLYPRLFAFFRLPLGGCDPLLTLNYFLCNRMGSLQFEIWPLSGLIVSSEQDMSDKILVTAYYTACFKSFRIKSLKIHHSTISSMYLFRVFPEAAISIVRIACAGRVKIIPALFV